ncbi:putative cyclase [Collybia nuda]|uniref:Cyclase n=1 Tax=Collybia nuda TaxID=64659 RepID=A0A9P5Y8B6_9AGAR|nr:putative cyclase [Collybia nuda]
MDGKASLLDLSHKLDSNVQIYPGDPAFSCSPFATVSKDGYSVHAVSLGTHTGTHIDAPSHFFADGKTIDQIPLSSLMGPLVKIDLTKSGLEERQVITWEDHIALTPAAAEIRVGVILLIQTGWAAYWGTPKYFHHPFLSRDAAQRILDKGVKVVGFDTLNPDETPFEGVGGEQGFGTHEVILGAGGVIAENLTGLERIGDQNMIALIPLNLEGCDGSPIRAFAWKGLTGL